LSAFAYELKGESRMISRIEALNYMCLKHVSVETGNFQLLVGPNASGKSTFLDIISFLSDFVNEKDSIEAVLKRAPTYEDILWKKSGSAFEFAIEFDLPENIYKKLKSVEYQKCRYELRINQEEESKEIVIDSEQLLVIKDDGYKKNINRKSSFLLPDTIISIDNKRERSLFFKHANRDENYNQYISQSVYSDSKDYLISSTLPLNKRSSSLKSIPYPNEIYFPIATYLYELLTNGIHRIELNSKAMKKPASPGVRRDSLTDGSNLPWLVNWLKKDGTKKFNDWIKHIRTVLPEIKTITTVVRPEDKHRYIVINYGAGIKVPSWLVSDGTMRFLALTILPYLSGIEGILLIEEPENGIHPKAVEAVYSSLSSVYDAQVFVTTHSPLMLSLVDFKQILCFSKTPEGAVEIIRGNKHPALRNWKGSPDLGLLFAGGVLG
jgi:predicted ATPase